MDLELVASFLALVAEGNFGRAAARLHLTSSALTKRIQRLERQLGVALIDRAASGPVTLTASGRKFAGYAPGLLTYSEEVREAVVGPTRTGSCGGSTIRLGFPAGTARAIKRHVNLRALAEQVRAHFPEVRISILDVPFTGLVECLPERMVDVLWANGPVPHPAVESFPTTVTSARVMVVGQRHPLAEAGAVDASDVVDRPLAYNPAVATEFMGGLWLNDLRPRGEARLVDMDADDQQGNLRLVADRGAAMITYPDIANPLGARLRMVRLTGPLPAAIFYVARRRCDRYGPIAALTEAVVMMAPRHLAGPPDKPGS